MKNKKPLVKGDLEREKETKLKVFMRMFPNWVGTHKRCGGYNLYAIDIIKALKKVKTL